MKRFARNLVTGLAVVMGYPFPAAAHDYTGGSLGPAATATDYHAILCSNDGSGATHHLFLQLTAGRPATAPMVSAQIQVPTRNLATSVTDPVNGDVQSSRGVEVAGGDGLYYVTVGKSGPGRANYSFSYHCQTATGQHSETSLNTFQNQ